MKTFLSLLVALLLTQSLAPGQTADQYVAQGRADLAAHDLMDANTNFAAALALVPNHATADVFYAATRLLALPNQPAGQAFLNRLGVAATNRSIYNWTALPPADTNGIPLAPTNLSAAEISDFLLTNIMGQVIGAASNLAWITDTNFTLTLTSNETTTVGVTVDYGDLLLLQAGLQAAQYAGYTIHSWNLDAQLTTLRSLLTNTNTTAQGFLAKFPNLFTFETPTNLAAARLAFSNAVNLYLNASAFIRDRPTNVVRLFNYDPSMTNEEAEFRTTLSDLGRSLNGWTVLTYETNYNANLSNYFAGAHSPRSLFPRIEEDSIVAGTLPDPTFGGVVEGLASYEVDSALGRKISFISNFEKPQVLTSRRLQITLDALSGSFLDIQVSTNLKTWTDYLWGTAQQGVLSFIDTNAFGVSRKFYRALDLSSDLAVSGTVFAVPSGNRLANAQVVLSFPNDPSMPSLTNYTDTAGNFLIYSTVLPPSGNYQLTFSSPGYASFQTSGYYYGDQQPVLLVYLAGPGYFPANDNFAQAPTLSGTNLTTTGYNVNATAEAGEPNPTQQAAGQSVWWTWTAPANGAVTLDTLGSSFPTVMAIYTGDSISNLTLVAAAAANTTNSTSQIDFFVTPGTTYQIQVDGYAPYGYGLITSGQIVLDLKYSHPRLPTITSQPQNQTAFTGQSVDFYVTATGTVPLSFQWMKKRVPIPGATNSQSYATDSSQYSSDYYLAGADSADATIYSVQVSNAAGSIVSSNVLLTVIPPPLNDAFSNRIVITGSAATVTGYNEGATKEPGEPDHAGNPGGASVWWTWTAPSNGVVTISTAGKFYPLLAIYTGNNVSNLTQVASDSFDAGEASVCRVAFSATAGTAYQIAVDGYNNGYSVSEGSITLNLNLFLPSPNDNFAQRAVISGLPTSVTGSNQGATEEPGEPNHAGNQGGASVWWTWTAQTNCAVTVDTAGSSFYTLLSVYTGNVLTNLTVVAEDTVDAGSSYDSRVAFIAIAGTAYQIAVDGYFDGNLPARGTIKLNVNPALAGLGTGALAFTVLHTFTANPLPSGVGVDGAYPYTALVEGLDGSLYGTTSGGGTNGNGLVFSVQTSGVGFNVLHDFTATDTNGFNSDGAVPNGLIQGEDGRLYGTAYAGGTNALGTAFALSTNGSGFTVLHTFGANTPDGANPSAPLLQGLGGRLYGTTYAGGTNGLGTAFASDTNGSGFIVLHTFGSSAYAEDGANPSAALMQGPDDTLYGTAQTGGYNGYGTIFSLNTNGTDFTPLYAFSGYDGATPASGLVEDSSGHLYGVTLSGGFYQNGVMFSTDTKGNGLDLLHEFTSEVPNLFANADGAQPVGLMSRPDNALYGAAAYGGAVGSGTLFSTESNGRGFAVMYTFTLLDQVFATNTDGAAPQAGLIQGRDGRLYGTASSGGTNGLGTIFALALSAPSLRVAVSGKDVLLSWPSWASDFVLETSPTRSSGAVWTPISGAVLSGGSFVVTNPVAGKGGFFRLHKP